MSALHQSDVISSSNGQLDGPLSPHSPRRSRTRQAGSKFEDKGCSTSINPDSTTVCSEGSEYGAASVSNEKGETARGESDQFIPILLPHIQRYSPVPRTPPQPPIEKPAQVHKGKSSKYEKYEQSKGGALVDIDEWRGVVEQERWRPIDAPFPEDDVVQDAASPSGTSAPALEEAIFREFLNSGMGNDLSVGCEGLDASIPKTPADRASLEGGLNGAGDFPQTVGGVLGLPGFDEDRASPSQSLDIAAGRAKSPSENVYGKIFIAGCHGRDPYNRNQRRVAYSALFRWRPSL
ncbi:hypothetical protein R3P38DRAFT_1742238 [Favolaschia claudopus]|uniref:Uncharacterized protein n=1 Tax=Favolaschia claudopus TaxID=2862362 RepID=A0AAW0DGT2_9AGAR